MSGPRVAGLLLAAGQGLRFGGGKLDAECAGQPLGLHGATALASVASAGLFAVTPARRTPFTGALSGLGYQLLTNAQPALGMAHSIALGVAAISDEVDAVLITLADMPHITADHLASLITAYHCNPRIIGTSSGDMRTPPAIFPRATFAALLALKGDAGARDMLRTSDHVAVSLCDVEDVDTPQDLQIAINRLR